MSDQPHHNDNPDDSPPSPPAEKPAPTLGVGATVAPSAEAAGDDGDDGRQRPAIPEVLPVLPIRGTVMFPGTIVPLGVGRSESRKLLDESLPKSKIIALATQKDEEEEQPDVGDLYTVGVAAMVLKLIRQPDDTVSIIVHGLSRIRLQEPVQEEPFLRARVQRVEETPGEGREFEAAVKLLRDQAHELIEMSPNAPEQATTVLKNIEEPSNLADFLAANLELEVQEKQDLLEQLDVPRRIRRMQEHVSQQLEMGQLQQKIQQDVQETVSDNQRKFFLREQMKAIQRELGEGEDGPEGEAARLREQIEQADPPENVMKEAERELGRLEAIPPASPEYSMITTYLELIADLPWNQASEQAVDLPRAREVLDRDHYDLEKVKRRLIEYLAVRKLNPQGRGPILCLVGPPGVGKTSLGQSVANALGRAFVRMSLGGIRDEAEIRGHRRTYIGAMPGRVIQETRRAGTNNPVMMLDEVDKLGADFRGDPASALLEVLDPRQNNAFVDRYLDVPFDLSQVIFIATANYMGTVPPALHDRMEVIEIPGYTDNDKLTIARRYLVPRQLKEHGLKKKQCRWRVGGLRMIIENYTREAGVRDLERQIGAVCRAVAADVAGGGARAGQTGSDGRKTKKKTKRGKKKSDKAAAVSDEQEHTITGEFVRQTLGPEKYLRELEVRTKVPGVAIGLAYTPVGGEVLFIEAASYAGKGNVTLTGQIGEVMKESVQAALSLFKSRASEFGLDVKQFSERDLHVHVPAGAVQKDGPSAGIAMYTAIASLVLNLPIRQRLAMTGEITLRGRVLPVGGIKEKSLAASRAGVKTILLPERNQRNLEEVDEQVKKKVHFEFVENVDQVLENALGDKQLRKARQDSKKR